MQSRWREATSAVFKYQLLRILPSTGQEIYLADWWTGKLQQKAAGQISPFYEEILSFVAISVLFFQGFAASIF